MMKKMMLCALMALSVCVGRGQSIDALIARAGNKVDDVSGMPLRQLLEQRKFLAEAVQCIANGDAAGFATHCYYPIERPYPLPAIHNANEMVAYFDVLFDTPMRIRCKAASHLDWDCLGWRGQCFKNGELWDYGYMGYVTRIGYCSPREQALQNKRVQEELASLHPSLRVGYKPMTCFRCNDGTVVRIDQNEDDFRMACYWPGTDLRGEPSLVLTGLLEPMGSMGLRFITFSGRGYEAEWNEAGAEGDLPEGEEWTPLFSLSGPRQIEAVNGSMDIRPWPELLELASAEEDEVFAFPEQQPSFPGGTEAMFQFLAKNIRYPQSAIESGIKGKVYVAFVVEKDGSITNARVMRDIGAGCGEEAKRVVMSMPRWTPAKQRGKVVRAQYTLPVTFTM